MTRKQYVLIYWYKGSAEYHKWQGTPRQAAAQKQEPSRATHTWLIQREIPAIRLSWVSLQLDSLVKSDSRRRKDSWR